MGLGCLVLGIGLPASTSHAVKPGKPVTDHRRELQSRRCRLNVAMPCCSVAGEGGQPCSVPTLLAYSSPKPFLVTEQPSPPLLHGIHFGLSHQKKNSTKDPENRRALACRGAPRLARIVPFFTGDRGSPHFAHFLPVARYRYRWQRQVPPLSPLPLSSGAGGWGMGSSRRKAHNSKGSPTRLLSFHHQVSGSLSGALVQILNRRDTARDGLAGTRQDRHGHPS